MLLSSLRQNEIKESPDGYSSGSIKYYPPNLNGGYFQSIKNPFGNCQSFLIGWFNYFLRSCNNSNEFIENLKFVSARNNNKRILIVDVCEYDFKTIKKYIEESRYDLKTMILSSKPYLSTNGSKMRIVQFNLLKTIQS